MLLGDERGRTFMMSMHDNKVRLSPSNGDSADLVARGEFSFSLVDNDDVASRVQQHPCRSRSFTQIKISTSQAVLLCPMQPC